MASERSPLVSAALIIVRPVGDSSRKRSRRLVSFLLSIAFLTAAIYYLLHFVSSLGHRHHFRPCPSWESGVDGCSLTNRRLHQGRTHKKLKDVLLKTIDVDHLERWSEYYTTGPHLAGKNKTQAEWTRDLWRSFGIEAHLASYDVYINYPKSSRLALLHSDGGATSEIKYECSLEEDLLDEDPTTILPERIPTFHGYSASGNVTAQYVYVNFGTVEDYNELDAAGVDLKGKIALAKYGRNFRGIKVQLAEHFGMVGVVMYSDPQEDGEITEVNGYAAYPEGPARNPSSLQRGSVQFLSSAPGDPTTIGYPSKPDAPRQEPNQTLAKIPSLPISYRDAIPLLRALNGHGPSSQNFSKWWQGGGLAHKGIDYSIGPSPRDTVLNLVNDVEYTTTPLWNVIGLINGTAAPDQTIVVGNHRDAWIVGGAGDPNSGSAVLNEVVRGYGEALKMGWKPQRTIVFASWDGEEYGLIGSTEWVEEFAPWLGAEAMTYLNVDVATGGPVFGAAASPLINHALRSVAASVPSPNQTVKDQSIYDAWKAYGGDAHISTLGSGSDYTAFLDFAGVSSVDLGFKPGRETAVYHYHSNYDSFHWMKTFGDPGFEYHLACARLLSLLSAEMLETPVIPYIASEYADALITYLDKAKQKLDENTEHTNRLASLRWSGDDLSKHSFKHLRYGAARVREAAESLDKKAAGLMADIEDNPFWWRWLHGRHLRRELRRVNEAYKQFERSFLHEKGLDGRNWFKHVVFAPGKFTGYAGATFPGLVENIDEKNSHDLRRWEIIIGKKLKTARKAILEAL